METTKPLTKEDVALVVKDVIVNLGIVDRFDKIDNRLGRIESEVSQLKNGVIQLSSKVSELDSKVAHSTNVMLNVHGF